MNTYWLIEAPGPRWLGFRKGDDKGIGFYWSRDPASAMRFESESDAIYFSAAVGKDAPGVMSFEPLLGRVNFVERSDAAAPPPPDTPAPREEAVTEAMIAAAEKASYGFLTPRDLKAIYLAMRAARYEGSPG